MVRGSVASPIANRGPGVGCGPRVKRAPNRYCDVDDPLRLITLLRRKRLENQAELRVFLKCAKMFIHNNLVSL